MQRHGATRNERALARDTCVFFLSFVFLTVIALIVARLANKGTAA